MDLTERIIIENFERHAEVAIRALSGMAYCWEQLDYEPPILSDGYPFEKSFDEMVFEFSNWIHNWQGQI